jgi:N utilization substance protein B
MLFMKKFNVYKGITLKKNNKPSKRHNARCKAMQALYQWEYTHQEPAEILAQFLLELNEEEAESAYFTGLVQGTIADIENVDAVMQSSLDRPLSELNPVERAILRAAIYELIHKLDVPYRVVINEALEIGKKFGSDQGHKFVNGVLDALAAKLRATEICK